MPAHMKETPVTEAANMILSDWSLFSSVQNVCTLFVKVAPLLKGVCRWSTTYARRTPCLPIGVRHLSRAYVFDQRYMPICEAPRHYTIDSDVIIETQISMILLHCFDLQDSDCFFHSRNCEIAYL